MNYSRELLDAIKKIKKKLPLLQHLFIDKDLPSCSKVKEAEVSNLRELCLSWRPNESNRENAVSSIDIKGKERTLFKCIKCIFIPNDQLHFLKLHYEDLLKRKQKGEKSDLTEKENITRIERIFNFHQSANECAHLISAYFRLPALTLSGLYEFISRWAI